MAATFAGETNSIIILTDSYKVSHHKQYPPNTTDVYSYFECRGHRKGQGFPEVCFFGLQYILKRWLVGPVVTQEKISEAKELFGLHFGQQLFNEEGWNYILQAHGGHLPIRIKAVPEGMTIPTQNVLLTVENTDPKCYWLTNYLEALLVQVWYPLTVATLSRAQKSLIAAYLNETADNLASLPFKLHDFGCRGSTSMESAGIGGCAHLVNFRSSDTMPAYVVARQYYGCKMASYSVPAAEHSTITSWGRDNEVDAFHNMLTQFPKGIVACVSDSYNIWNACEKIWGEDLKHLIELREGTLVVRPDSGTPHEVVVKVLDILGKKFGCFTNTKGYKQLPPFIRVIQGDGINFETLGQVLEAMKVAKWSAENVVFGSGGALLQRVDRDTQKCAFKCSYAIVNGKGVDVYKDPVTDPEKKSKKGKLTLELIDNQYVTVQEGRGQVKSDILVTVFENGKLLRDYTFDEIRANAELSIVRHAKQQASTA